MELLPLTSRILKNGDDLLTMFVDAELHDRDIVVVSSKVIAMTEGAAYDLATMEPSDQAIDLARTNQKSAAFREAMLRELARLNGRVVNRNNSVLTEVRPEGMDGSIVISSAGLDESNADGMYAIGWPKDPVTSAVALRHALKERCKKNVAVVVTDSCCHPRRIGVTAFALVVVGFDPIENYIGKKDLFGRQLLVTREARADQLATAANFLMGNADQAIPAVIVRGHGLPFSDFAGWVPGIKKEEDMFNIG